ncbi:amino acid ABC transporter permease [Ureibacillus thermosphaericus]|uniref:L-cystine transport system permease protein n=1 Tax=Ureibacillus thermosphaericus TaxID=51173 RepID=A0A840PVF5_URETH|nr:amino acid ABC transporter permease [Ureibacillus thermosphaericus]MBB5149913.1 L-cystine transport system permease protein [Ureibacillus thermosphaericus]NKZ32588.1 amino acid ABC transporter permease [Ureibacillus thermosphaericus]
MFEKYFDIGYLWGAFPQLLPYLKITFAVAGLAVFFGTLLGLVLAFMKMGKSRVLQVIAHGYTTIMRCTPSIVLLFLVYYGVPFLADSLFNVNLQNIYTGVFVVITFSLQFAAMMSEVTRSAIQSIDKGQFEAAVSVGLTPWQAYRRIIFPQAFVVALPNFGNGLIAILQEGALAYTIGFIDIVGKANLIIASNFNSHALEIYIALAVIYWVISIVIEKIFELLEKTFSKGSRSIKAS